MNGKRIVIDASVALKWRLRDEEATSQADALLEDFLARKLELLTPTLFDYEIANALRVAVTRQHPRALRLARPAAARGAACCLQGRARYRYGHGPILIPTHCVVQGEVRPLARTVCRFARPM